MGGLTRKEFMNTIFNHDFTDVAKITKTEPKNDDTLEVIRAVTFFFKQIKKGWNFLEAEQQVENQYGFFIKESVLYYIARNLNK